MTRELGYDVAVRYTGREHIRRAIRDLRDISGSALGESRAALKDFGQAWQDLATPVNQSLEILNKVGEAVKRSYAALQEGAALEAAEQRFERLAASIGTTAESLETEMSRAAKGMVTDAQIIEGASQIISLGLGNSEQEVVRLATAVNTLGLDMQQVILTFANNSKARLDALGLSVEDVTTKAKALEEQGFDADKAFDTAVLEALEDKMELLGDASETTAGKLQQLEVAYTNAANAFKQEFAESLAGDIDALGDDAEAASAKLEILATATGGSVVPALKNVAQLVPGVATAMAQLDFVLDRIVTSHEEEAAALEKQQSTMRRAAAAVESYDRAITRATPSNTAYAESAEEVSATVEELEEGLLNGVTAWEYNARVAQDAAQAVDAYEVTAQDVAAAEKDRARATEEAAKAAEEAAEKQRKLTAAMGDYFVDAVNAGDAARDFGQIAFDALDQAGAGADALAEIGVRLGIFDEEAAAAAQTTVAFQAAVSQAAEALVAGEIGAAGFANAVSQAQNAAAGFDGSQFQTGDIDSSNLDNIANFYEQELTGAQAKATEGAASVADAVSAIDSKPVEDLTTSTRLLEDELHEAGRKAEELKTAINSIPRQVNVSVNYTQTGAPPGQPPPGPTGRQTSFGGGPATFNIYTQDTTSGVKRAAQRLGIA